MHPGYSLRTFIGHSASVMSLDFHPNKEDLICSCDADSEIRYWSMNNGNCARVFKVCNNSCRANLLVFYNWICWANYINHMTRWLEDRLAYCGGSCMSGRRWCLCFVIHVLMGIFLVLLSFPKREYSFKHHSFFLTLWIFWPSIWAAYIFIFLSFFLMMQGGTSQVRFQPHFGRYLAAAAENVVSILDVETQACRHSLQVGYSWLMYWKSLRWMFWIPSKTARN